MAKDGLDHKRQVAARVTRARLLRTAHALFTKHGYETVSLRMIARAADVSTGAVFTHWPAGKDELFLEAIGRPAMTDAMGSDALAALHKLDPARARELLHAWACGVRPVIL